MNCPVCGDKIPSGKSKCLRCGYICKAVATVKQYENKKEKNGGENSGEPEKEFREVSPDDVRMSGGSRGSRGGGILDELFGDSIFGGFTSILDELLGFNDPYGPFGDIDYEEYDGRDADGFPVDVFDRDFVEVHEVETFDADGNLKHNKKESASGSSHKNGGNDRRGNRGRRGKHGK